MVRSAAQVLAGGKGGGGKYSGVIVCTERWTDEIVELALRALIRVQTISTMARKDGSREAHIFHVPEFCKGHRRPKVARRQL